MNGISAKERIGQKFGLLTILDTYREKRNNGKTYTMALCKCDCGNTKPLVLSDIIKGCRTKRGCGCLKNKPTHGQTIGKVVSVEYTTWLSIKARCYYPKHQYFNRYGGRGITVCDEWLHSFESFINHIGKRPSPKHSIDRINNDGNYEPGNVRWATTKEQSDNRPITIKLEYNGKIRNIKEISQICGINGRLIRRRLSQGQTIEQATTLSERQKKMEENKR